MQNKDLKPMTSLFNLDCIWDMSVHYMTPLLQNYAGRVDFVGTETSRQSHVCLTGDDEQYSSGVPAQLNPQA